MLFSFWISKRRKGNKRGKETRGGISRFPPLDSPLKRPHRGRGPYVENPGGSPAREPVGADDHIGPHAAPPTSFCTRRTPGRPDALSNSRKSTPHRRTGRRRPRASRLTSGSKYSPSGAGSARPFPIGQRPDGDPNAARTAGNDGISEIRYTGRPGVRPVQRGFEGAACGPSGSLAPTETARSYSHQRGLNRNEIFDHRAVSGQAG